MPVWIYLQLFLLFGWIVAAFFFYWAKSWKIGRTFNLYDGLFISIKFAVLGWLASSILLGVVYVMYSMNSGKLLPVITLLLMPITIILVFSIRYYWVSIESNRRDNVITTKTKECKEWVQKFPFLNNEMIEIKIYLSNGRATGRLIIHDVNQKQVDVLNNSKSELPDEIHLVIFSKNENNNPGDDSIYH